MKIRALLLLAMAALLSARAVFAADTVFYADAPGDHRFNGVHELSDGTVLVSASGPSLDWLPAGVPVTEMAAAGIDSTSAGALGYLLHLSADLADILRAVHFPVGTVVEINHIRTTEVPGEATGDLYVSGRRANGATEGYYVARLNNNFVAGPPTGIVWAYNVEARRTYLDIQPWDVRGDGKVVAASGNNNSWEPAFLLMLGAEDGLPVRVDGWRRHYGESGNFWEGGPAEDYPHHDTDPITHSVLMLNANSTGGLRSVTQEDFDAIEFDGHNHVRMGRHPDDLYLAGPNTTAGRGYTGYRMTSSSYRMGQIAVDRRNNHLYFGGNVQTNHAGNQPDFELHAVGLDNEGFMQWWSRLYTSMVAADGINRSTNAFGSWTASNGGLGNPHVRALAYNPADADVVYAGTYGGIYKSTDAGATWSAANDGMTADWVLDIAVAPSQPETVYAATNRGVFKSIDAGGSWSAVNTGLTYLYVNTLAVDPTNADVVYAGTARHGVFKTTDGGGAWTAANNGLESDADTLWVNAIVLDPVDPEIVYIGSAGGHGISRSVDGGATWAAANSGLTADGRYVFSLAIHRDGAEADATLYLGCRQGVYRSTDSGASWATAYGSGATFIGYRADGRRNTGTLGSVRALIIHPDDPDTVFAGHAYCGAYKTTDGGANWSQTNTGLPNRSHTIGNLHNMVFALAMHPDDPDTLLLGSLGIPRASIPDQYVDSVAVDYSKPAGETLVAVVGRHHGNDHANLWNGDTINPANNPDHPGNAYHNRFTGTSGNLHLSWIGKLADNDGRLMYATRLAENPDQTNWGSRYPNDSILDGWPSRNAGWPNLNTTPTRGRPPAFDNEGRLHVVAIGRRTHTTRNAWQKMPNPSRVASITAVESAAVFRSDALVGNSEIRPGISEITFTSAPNNNVRRMVADFDTHTGEVTLDAPLASLPSVGNGFRIVEGMSAWNNFVRVFSEDFSTLAYSSLIVGEWDRTNAVGGSNVEVLSIFPSTNGLFAVGYHTTDNDGVARDFPVPTQNIPAWGTHLPNGETPVIARLHIDKPATVRLARPLPRAEYYDSQAITLDARAESNGATIERVEFFANGERIGEATAPPHTFTWLAEGGGPRLLSAVAHLEGGGSVRSVNVPVTILATPEPPSAPVALAATAVSAGGVTLGWTPGSDNEETFHIERRPAANGDWEEVGTAPGDSNTFVDSTVEPEASYRYRVRASNFSGTSPHSNEITVIVPAAATDFVKINFQPSGAPVPEGYLADTGAVFGDRGNGYVYGWNATNTATRDRGGSTDLRYRTLNHMQQNGDFSWSIEVPNGTYEVLIVAGDPSHFDSVYRIDVQGVRAIDTTPTSGNRFAEATVAVPVTDGRIRITNAPGAENNKICFVEIARVPDAPDETPFAAWIADPAHGVPEDMRGPLDAPAGDDIANILKFAMGIEPMTPGHGVLPVVDRETVAAGEHVYFILRQRSGGTGTPGIDYTVDGIRYRAETTPHLDASEWHHGSEWFELAATPTENGDGTETVILRLKAPVAPGAPAFIRLRIDGE